MLRLNEIIYDLDNTINHYDLLVQAWILSNLIHRWKLRIPNDDYDFECDYLLTMISYLEGKNELTGVI